MAVSTRGHRCCQDIDRQTEQPVDPRCLHVRRCLHRTVDSQLLNAKWVRRGPSSAE